MALATCRDCRQQVSRSATACPHCGRPFRSDAKGPGVQTIQKTGEGWKFMKMIGTIGLMVGVCWGVAAYSNQDPTPNAPPNPMPILGSLLLYAFSAAGACWNHG